MNEIVKLSLKHALKQKKFDNKVNEHWLNYWHTSSNKGTSGFTSITLLMIKNLYDCNCTRYNSSPTDEGLW